MLQAQRTDLERGDEGARGTYTPSFHPSSTAVARATAVLDREREQPSQTQGKGWKGREKSRGREKHDIDNGFRIYPVRLEGQVKRTRSGAKAKWMCADRRPRLTHRVFTLKQIVQQPAQPSVTDVCG
eukprot:843677-Pleurochrysis_carterae.AAC.1